jgi:hypothetical protein
MMQRDGALPSEAREKCDTTVFLILRKRLEILHNEISEGKECQGKGHCEETMDVSCLKNKRDGRENISQLHGEQNLSKAAIHHLERRDRI